MSIAAASASVDHGIMPPPSFPFGTLTPQDVSVTPSAAASTTCLLIVPPVRAPFSVRRFDLCKKLADEIGQPRLPALTPVRIHETARGFAMKNMGAGAERSHRKCSFLLGPQFLPAAFPCQRTANLT